MTGVLVRKLLRDVRAGWAVAGLLLFAFQVLWARVTDRVSNEILAAFRRLGLNLDALTPILFEQGPGQMVQAMMGGESIRADRPMDMLSIAYVHPLTQMILCLWAVGRAGQALAGELDRGTLELLLAQPVRRSQVVLANVAVELLTIPALCLAMWAGTAAGVALTDVAGSGRLAAQVDLWRFGPALLHVAGLAFAVHGLTLWLSAAGRSRTRVWGVAVCLALGMFLVNVVGQLWAPLGWLRPLTVFYYYRPQPLILEPAAAAWWPAGVLAAVAVAGYGLALATFCRRDLPAPL